MAIAISDMQAVDQLTPAEIEKRMPLINESDGCVLDANLPEDTLRYIAKNASVPLIIDPVSCHKAHKVRAILPHLSAIKPNLMEAETLTGEQTPEKAAQALRNQGVQRVFISLGAKGVYYAGPEEEGIIPAIPLAEIPLTGAGDALVAGVTLALLQKKSTKEAAQAGCRAAYHALTGTL